MTTRRRPLGGAMAQWMTRRQLPAESFKAHVLWNGYAFRVARLVMPQNMRPNESLDKTAEQFDVKHPGIIRVTDPDPGRCLLTVRMDDALPLLRAYQEEHW